MLGAIIGDIVGSPFEFANVTTFRNKPLFSPGGEFTDDTICTIAVADALLTGEDFGSALRRWCRKYPNPMGGYGGSFRQWVFSDDAPAYNSWGNGAAMRVSPCGWTFDSEAETLRAALASAAPTHNHVEGLIGASVVAQAIYRLRTERFPSFRSGSVADLVEQSYGEDWTMNLPARGEFDETCQGCVPLAFHICMVSADLESALRHAVEYGGDSDTLCAIVGSLAEARWGIPHDIKKRALSLLPSEMVNVIVEFSKRYGYEC